MNFLVKFEGGPILLSVQWQRREGRISVRLEHRAEIGASCVEEGRVSVDRLVTLVPN